MAVRIQFKRGNVSPGTTLYEGEPAFRLDTKELFIGTGVGNQPVRIISKLDWSQDFSILVANTAGNPTPISLGANTILGRLGTGNVKALTPSDVWSIINGQNTTNINAAGFRIINVGNPVNGTDAVNKNYVDTLVAAGLTFHEAVIDINVNTPPTSPAAGDRYWIGSSPTGAWTGKAYQIAEWDGTTWVFYPVTKGDAAYCINENKFYFFDGTQLKTLSAGIGPHASTHAANGSDPIDVKDLADSMNLLLNHAITAKGQIIVGTGPGTYVALNPGTNGQVLVVDSTQPSGVKWVDPSVVGRTTFAALNDVPHSYTGYAGYLVAVNNAETGLEFVNVIDGGTL